jgi:hypothetical protein
MKIAILVWGSLYWDPRNLQITGNWFYDGPSLPIEFARISGDNRLTLILKPGFDSVTVLYAISSHNTFEAARENLRNRENTPNIDNIGFIDFTNNTQQVRPTNSFIIEILRLWNEDKGFDAILWSDFSPRFTDIIGRQFSLENVTAFIDALPNNEKQIALSYIRNTPAQVDTRFRKSIEQYFEGVYL